MRRMRALALIALVLAPSVARADASDDSHARYEQGVAAFQKGDFGAAVAAFADVYRATGETKHLWNLAFAEYEAKRAFDALVHMRAYVAKEDANPKNLERAREYEAALEKKVTRVKLVAPEGAEIDVDGAQYGVAPIAATIDLDPDKPHVIVAKRGTDSAKQTLSALGARSIDVTLAFPVASPMPVVAPMPAAGPAPAPTPPPAPPPPPVTVAASPPPPATSTQAADPAAQHPEHHGWGARTWLTLGLGVGAVAAIGAGVYFGVQSTDDANTATGLSDRLSSSACNHPSAANGPSCAQLSSAISSQGSENTASIVFYSVGGALALGAVAAFLFVPHDSAPSTSGIIVPMIGRDVAGAGYAARF